MRVRSVGGLSQFLAAACCAGASAVLVAGCTAAGHASNLPRSVSQRTASSDTGGTLRVLQMNLCDSGIAPCYSSGRAVIMAAALIHARRPDVVTLNEVCRGDVSVLKQAMSATFPDARIVSAFRPAGDRRTDRAYQCLNAQQFGDGVLVLVPGAATRYRAYGGVYPTQDLTDPEERVWLCIDVAAHFTACTTHTANTSTAIALAQCQYLLRTAVPRVRRQDGDDPVVVGADLNLPAGQTPSPQSCLPAGYRRADDGARQDVATGQGATIRSRTVIDMHRTTDHPGLLVEVALPPQATR
jgi:hypothetical protein